MTPSPSPSTTLEGVSKLENGLMNEVPGNIDTGVTHEALVLDLNPKPDSLTN